LDEVALQRLVTASAELCAAPLLRDDTSLITHTEIAARTLAFAAQSNTPMGAVVIDVADPCWSPVANDGATTGTRLAIEAFGALAARLRAPVLITTQISRRPEDRCDPRPRLTDVRLADVPLIRAANLVLMLYRDEIYDPQSELQGAWQIRKSGRRTRIQIRTP
jgi:replicative DNA helicase